MVNFSEENRKFFEAMSIPLTYYRRIEGTLTPILVSDGFCEMMNLSREELIGTLKDDTFELVHPDDAVRMSIMFRDFSERKGPYNVIFRRKFSDGEYHYLHVIGKYQKADDGGEAALFVYTDISINEADNRELLKSYTIFHNDHFYTDRVTQLPNINYLLEFSEEIRNNIRKKNTIYALGIFDITGLRFYNSQYGYARGDQLLKVTAEVMKEEFPESFLYRGEEDHFILIAPFEEDDVVAKRIRSINDKVKINAFGNTSGVQAGICVIQPQLDISGALDHAKHALKLIGNDLNMTHRYYTLENDEKYWSQRYILDSFDSALKNEWIKVYYQAIMRVKTGKAAAAEALARWIDPLRGIISPVEFIQVLDKYHLLYKLDLYMVEQICKEIPTRKEMNLPLIPVTINFSAQDFDHADIVSSLNEIFSRYGISKDLIIIEITEQDLAAATDQFSRQIEKLRENGFRIWIDDFGSGYSALNIFTRFNADVTKFDSEFLMNLDENNGANRAILRAMVGVTRELGIKSLCEGLEKPEHLDFLKEIGCEFAQGYYYYKPQSLGEIDFKLRNGGSHIECETPEERLKFSMEG